jgi:hypothetical protein
MENLFYNQIEDSVKEKCWKLSSYILAEYDFRNLRHPWDEPWCFFASTFSEKFENTFIKELIEMAALMRSLQDVHSNDNNEESNAFPSNDIGLLIHNDGTQEVLDFRKACNKIIHALEYSIDLTFSNEHPLSNGKDGYNDSTLDNFKSPIIITRGKYGKLEWQASIYFFKFIEQAIKTVS